MKKNFFLLVIAFFFLANVMAAEETEERVDLGYRLENSTNFRYQLTIDTVSTQQVLDQFIRHREKWEIDYSFQVTGEKKGDGYPITVTYDSINFAQESPFEQFEYNLAESEAGLPDSLRPYAGVIGTNFSLLLTNQAVISPESTTYFPKLNTKNLSPTDLTFHYMTVYFPYLAGNIFILPYPKTGPQQLQIGETWKLKIPFSNGKVSPNMDTVFTIKEIKNNSFLVTAVAKTGGFKLNRTFSMGNNKPSAGFDTDLTGTMEGTVEVERINGLPLTGNIQITLSGDLLRLGRKIPVTFNLTIDLQRLNWDKTEETL